MNRGGARNPQSVIRNPQSANRRFTGSGRERGRSLCGQERSVRAPQAGYRPKVDGGKGPTEAQEADAAVAKRVIGSPRARALHSGGVTALLRDPVDIIGLGKIHVDVKEV